MCICFFALSLSVGFSQGGMSTARQHYNDVLRDVKNNHGDSVVFIGAVTMSYSGKTKIAINQNTGQSEMWAYAFLSPVDRQVVSGLAVDHEILGHVIGEVSSQDWPSGTDTIYNSVAIRGWWIDSDTAALAWNTSGLKGFLDQRPDASVYIIRLTNILNQGLEWNIKAADDVDTMSCSFNAYTGDLIDCAATTLVEDDFVPNGWDVGDVYPNPIHVGEFGQLVVKDCGPSSPNIGIYDIHGRLLCSASNQKNERGSIDVIIPRSATMHTGVYFVSISSEYGVSVRRYIVVK